MSLKSKVNWCSSLGEISRTPWETIGRVCKEAAVFVDDGAGELLHWAGGIALLGGCVGVYDLHSELAPIAKDFIAAVSSLLALEVLLSRVSVCVLATLYPSTSTGPILPCGDSGEYISTWCCQRKDCCSPL